jgi:hypothetical protein
MTDQPSGPAGGQFAHVDAEGLPADSAGQAWAGKTIPSHGFGGDLGEADEELVVTLRALRAQRSEQTERAAVARVGQARWLVPVLAVATELQEVDGLTHDTRSDMATVTLTSPDGQRALPAFSSLTALAQWDPSARPVAVRAAAAAQAAVSEGCEVLVLDVASEHATVLRPSMLWALAQEREWLPSHRDPHVAAAVAGACREEALVRGHRLEAGDPPGAGVLRVVLALAPGLAAEHVTSLATRIGERIATDGETRARIDALTFAIEAADQSR